MIKYLKRNKFLLFITVLFAIISSASMVFLPVFMQRFIDYAIVKDFYNFKRLLIYTIFYVITVGLLFFIYNMLSKKLNIKISILLRKNVFEGIFNQNFSEFSSRKTSDYISFLTNDIKLVEDNFLIPLLLCIQNVILFIATTIILILYSPLITIVLFTCISIMFVVPLLFGKILKNKQNILSNKFATFTSKLKEMFSGYEVIKCFNIKKDIIKDFESHNKDLSSAKFLVDKILVMNETLAQVLGFSSQLLAIFLCSYLVLKGTLTAGILVAIIQLSGSIVAPVSVLMNNIPRLASMKPILRRLDEFSEHKQLQSSNSLPLIFDKSISCTNLSFGYSEHETIINNINLHLKKNKKYALVGESGCGKSTLIKLLIGYYSNFCGEIKYDDTDIRHLNIEDLSGKASLIHQNIYMFDMSIKDNICLYNDFPEEALSMACSLSGVDKFYDIASDDSMNCVGEAGCNLSGGQRQRISIARALIRKTPLLILDEGTSAVDMQTAYDIESKLLNIEDLTLLTITHKMSDELLGLYDEIIFMKNGTIAEQGPLNELLNKKSEFYNFYTLQLNN